MLRGNGGIALAGETPCSIHGAGLTQSSALTIPNVELAMTTGREAACPMMIPKTQLVYKALRR